MGKMVGGRNNDEGMRKSAHRGRGKKTPNAGGEGFIRNYLHLDNAKHLEPPSPRRCVTDAAAFGGGRQRLLVRASPAVPAENNCWVISEAHRPAMQCHCITRKPFKGKKEAP